MSIELSAALRRVKPPATAEMSRKARALKAEGRDVIALAAGGWWSLNLQYRVASQLVANDFGIANDASQLKTMVVEARRQEKDSLMSISDLAKFDQNKAMWDKNKVALDAETTAFEVRELTAEEREMLVQIKRD